MSRTQSTMPLLAAIVIPWIVSSCEVKAVELDQLELHRQVEALLADHGNNVDGSVWIGGNDGKPWFEYRPCAVRPTASSIKTYFLVELFDAYKDQLDSPLPGADAILNDDGHPAISHFSAKVRDEIRRELGGTTVRRVGKVMMGAESASNAVYNAAANLTTAVLGGPAELTALIRRRDPAFRTVTVNRYMLRDRNQSGDNVASPTAIAALYHKIATGALQGIDRPTLAAVQSVLRQGRDGKLGVGYSKGGSLASEPLTRVRAGWWDTPHGPLIYVVMLEQPNSGTTDAKETSEKLGSICSTICDIGVHAAAEACALASESTAR